MEQNLSKSNMVWFISRHEGAREWIRRQCDRNRWQVDHFVDHIEPGAIKQGDLVVGTLPIQHAAQICSQGAEYWHLCITLQAEQRGIELTADDIELAGGELVRYNIREVEKCQKI